MDRILTPKAALRFRSKGFTLLEVLVALAVLAIALVSIFKLQGQTLQMSAKARYLSIAPHLAQTKLAELETQEIDNITDGSGVFPEPRSDYSWAVSVEEVPTDLITDNKYHLIRMNVTISNNDGENYQLRTYRFYTD
jgi:general secretion pathway protein I